MKTNFRDYIYSDMIDIFDQLKPSVVLTRQAAWAVATHRLLIPSLFFVVSMLVLGVVSMNLRPSPYTCNSAGSKSPVATPTIHAYPVPKLSVVSVSHDEHTLLVVVASASNNRNGESEPSKALHSDVNRGLVNTLVIGGRVWNATTYSSLSGGLELTSRSAVSYPFPPSVKGSFWPSEWGTAGAGALVLAFNDTSMNLG